MNAAELAQIADAFPWFFPTVAFLVGACVGSFLNVVIYRVPKKESIVTPGSHCGCGQPIAWHDNIPILSWLLLRGRARCCGRPFSVRYPGVEFFTALLFLGCWLRYPAPAVALAGMLFLSALVAATFIDLDHFIIPDVFTLGLGVTGLLLSLAVPALHGQHTGDFLHDALRSGGLSLLGSLIGSALVLWISMVAEAVLQKQAMGFGDVKFVGAIGAFCGWQGAVFAVFGGAVVGTIWFFIAWLWQRVLGKSSPVAPPVEKPQEEDEAPPFGGMDAFALGAGVVAILAALAVPALHERNSGVFFLDNIRAGTDALRGLFVASGFVLWIGLLIETAVRREFIPFNLVKFAGAVGAFTLWSHGAWGVARGLGLATLAGGLAWSGWWLSRRLRQRFVPATPESVLPVAADEDAPPALGFGVHIPFGPMLAIAAGAYFLFFREFVLSWLADIQQLF
jgi:leader peptidase (prepilin peptidase)/N-methyltransferase